MVHGDNKSRDVKETESLSSPRTMLIAAIAPPVGFTVYLLAMFLLLWWHRRRVKRRYVVQSSSMRGSVDLEGEADDVESKQHHPQRPPTMTFASSILEMPMSPSINSATPFAAHSRGYSGVMSISPVPTSPLTPTSPISPLGSFPLAPLRAPQLADNPLPTGKSSPSRNTRFRISVPAFVNRLSGGGIPITTGGGGGGGSGGAGAGGEGEGGGGGRQKRRQSRADPVLPRMTTPTIRFNSDDMLAPRRPRPPSLRQHIMHSPRVTATSAALVASTSPPPPNSPLPPTPLIATLTSASPISPMPPTPILYMLPRCASSLSKMVCREKTRVRPLPPLPLQQRHGLSSASPRLPLPPPPLQPPPPQTQPQLHRIGYSYLRRREGSTASLVIIVITAVAAAELSVHPIVGHRRRRAQDNNDSPPPYTSQYLDLGNDSDNNP
ncbi:hypothetical protein BGY98DRAFT_1018435 [Russula aff. rugulosa BPL654]|nr:hypothetical protein BGY98DRAFT_1018435 [Russula aff. rugulosa BPL654]